MRKKKSPLQYQQHPRHLGINLTGNPQHSGENSKALGAEENSPSKRRCAMSVEEKAEVAERDDRPGGFYAARQFHERVLALP